MKEMTNVIAVNARQMNFTLTHIICTKIPGINCMDDLIQANQNTIDLATHWLQYNV